MRLTSDGAFVSVAVGVRARVQAAAAYSVTVTASGNGGDRARAGTVRLMKEGTGRRDRDGSDWQGMRLRGAGDTGRQQQCGFAATVGWDSVTGGFTHRPGGGKTRRTGLMIASHTHLPQVSVYFRSRGRCLVAAQLDPFLGIGIGS